MKNRPTAKLLFRWAGTILCGLIFLTGLFSIWWQLLWIPHPYGGGGIRIGCAGIFWINKNHKWGPRSPEFRISKIDWPSEHGEYRRYIFLPRWRKELDGGSLTIPLWMPLAAAGIPTILLWRRSDTPLVAQPCRKCGYDLTGNVSGRCPECGTATEQTH